MIGFIPIVECTEWILCSFDSVELSNVANYVEKYEKKKTSKRHSGLQQCSFFNPAFNSILAKIFPLPDTTLSDIVHTVQ